MLQRWPSAQRMKRSGNLRFRDGEGKGTLTKPTQPVADCRAGAAIQARTHGPTVYLDDRQKLHRSPATPIIHVRVLACAARHVDVGEKEGHLIVALQHGDGFVGVQRSEPGILQNIHARYGARPSRGASREPWLTRWPISPHRSRKEAG